MNIVIDVGNTQIKVAVFYNNKLQLKEVCNNSSFEEVLKKIDLKYPIIRHALISLVGVFEDRNMQLLNKQYKTLVLSHNLNFPFINKYETPNTLGVDRIALSSAAVSTFPKTNCLIIDAGSCITYDFVTNKAEYLGGAISPGIKMRYKALHTFTKNLPELSPKKENSIIGKSTQSSINIGVVQGVLYEIQGYISQYSKEYKDLTIILTGGDAHFLLDSLNFNIFANSNFLLEGLNYILELNKN